MRKYYWLTFFLICSVMPSQSRGANDLSTFNISEAKMPVYNNGKLTILAYSKSATRSGIDIILKSAILDIIKPGIDVDQVKYVDGAKPYPLKASLKDVLRFWRNILHSDGLIFSDAAFIDHKDKNARSSEKIFFRSPVMDVDGVGFRADFNLRTIKILSNVVIKIRQLGDAAGSVKLLPGNKKTSKVNTSTITADQMFIDFTNNFINVSGNVKVNEDNMTIDCDKITVYLAQKNVAKAEKPASSKNLKGFSSGSSRRISRIVCENNVVISRKQSADDIKQNGRQQAFADRADYDFVKSMIVMTGKRPSIKRGTDKIEGKKIIIWRDKERMQAQGDCRLAFIAPDNKRLKKPDSAKIPTVATSDFMDMNYADNLAVMTGNVKVVDQRMKIDCHKMNIYLTDRRKKTKAKIKKRSSGMSGKTLSNSKLIDKIICIGDVTIFRMDGKDQDGTQKAMAGRAVYHLKEGKIILSENNPIIIRGRDSVSGEIITVWADQQKMHVDKNSLIVLNRLKKDAAGGATRVNSDYTNIDYRRNLMSFAGKVKVKDPQMVLDCQKMLIFLEDKKGQKTVADKGRAENKKPDDPLNMKSSDKEVAKIICIGDVFARDRLNQVRSRKITLMMQDKQNPGMQKGRTAAEENKLMTGGREISRIICEDEVVMIRKPDPAKIKQSDEKLKSDDVPSRALAGGSDKPITVKTDFMDLKLSENYGELVGNVDVDEPRARLKCDKMELFAVNTPATIPASANIEPAATSIDDEFENEDDIADNAVGDGTVPKKISLGDDKQLEKIICRNNVIISRKITADSPVKQQATGNKAVYMIEDGKIEMTENAALHQGDNVLHGRKITLWTDSERLDIDRGDVKEMELQN